MFNSKVKELSADACLDILAVSGVEQIFFHSHFRFDRLPLLAAT